MKTGILFNKRLKIKNLIFYIQLKRFYHKREYNSPYNKIKIWSGLTIKYNKKHYIMVNIQIINLSLQFNYYPNHNKLISFQ